MYFVWFNLLNFYHLGFNELFKYHMIYIYERSISQKKREREENTTHKKKNSLPTIEFKIFEFRFEDSASFNRHMWFGSTSTSCSKHYEIKILLISIY